MRRFSMPTGLAIVLLAFLPGCYRSPAVRFNDAIVEGTQKLHKSGEAFGRAVSTAISTGKDNDIKNAESAHDDTLTALKSVRNDFKSLTVPPGKAAKELHDSALDVLDQEERRLVNDLGDVMRIVRDKHLPGADKQRRIMEILT